MGTAIPPVRHIGYVMRQSDHRAYGHHELDPGTSRGAYRCGICGRLVVRGLGCWWETA